MLITKLNNRTSKKLLLRNYKLKRNSKSRSIKTKAKNQLNRNKKSHRIKNCRILKSMLRLNLKSLNKSKIDKYRHEFDSFE